LPATSRDPERCRKVTAGQTVRWAGDFNSRRLKNDAALNLAIDDRDRSGAPGSELLHKGGAAR
jgi:hypothetical protein